MLIDRELSPSDISRIRQRRYACHLIVGEYSHVTCILKYFAFDTPEMLQETYNNPLMNDICWWSWTGIVRNRPVPLPGSGMQLTNISHVRDLSSMLFLAVGKPSAANGNIFNCVSDRAVTLDGMTKLCAQAAGKEAKIVHYDPKVVGVDAKKAFPFRNMHFYAEPRAAKKILGWTSSTNLVEDLKERFKEYVSIGRDRKEVKFDIDDKILESLKVPVSV